MIPLEGHRFRPPFAAGQCRALLVLGVVLAMALGLAPVSSLGRVFLRTGLAKQMIDPVRIGWSEAFRGDFEIDGEAVAVQVLSSRSGTKITLERLESHFESRGGGFAGASGARLGWGLAVWPDRRAHVLLLSHPLGRGTLVFVNYRRPAGVAGLKSPLAADVPVYPGAELSRTVSRAESGLRIAFFETFASQGEVFGFYENSLAGNGWRPALRDARGSALPRSLLLYLKNGRLSCISVDSTGTGRMNVITVLTKDID